MQKLFVKRFRHSRNYCKCSGQKLDGFANGSVKIRPKQSRQVPYWHDQCGLESRWTAKTRFPLFSL